MRMKIEFVCICGRGTGLIQCLDFSLVFSFLLGVEKHGVKDFV